MKFLFVPLPPTHTFYSHSNSSRLITFKDINHIAKKKKKKKYVTVLNKVKDTGKGGERISLVYWTGIFCGILDILG